MATDNKNNIHPGTSLSAGLNNLLAFFKGNILFTLLSFFVFLGFILPPRSRKRRYGNHRRRTPVKRRKSGNRSRVRKRKKLPRAVGKISGQTKTDVAYGTPKERKKIKSYKPSKPAFMVKGSAAAKTHMAALRAMRKK